MAHRAVLAHNLAARLTLVMVSRSALAGLLMLALGPASESVLAQQQALAPSAANTIPTANTTSTPKAPAASTTATANQAAAKPHKTAKKSKKKEVQPEEPVVQAPPPPPPTPEESPAAAPQVTYQNGQLSIRSENSTLGSILTAVKARTGASIDGPAASSSERVATQLGPGDPRDVLTTLLNSTKYDFMLVGAPGSPNSVQKIILTARASGAPGQPAAGSANNVQRPNPAVQAPTDQPDADQTMPDAEIPDDANQVVDEPAPPEQPEQPQPQEQPQQGQPQPVPNGIGTQAPPAEGEQQNPNQPKSPEQLLQELQRMQQQQQQQQQPQHPEEPR